MPGFDVETSKTVALLDAHLDRFAASQADDLAKEYGEKSNVIVHMNSGTSQNIGVTNIHKLFEGFGKLVAEDESKFTLTEKLCYGNTGFIRWTMTTKDSMMTGTDTFVREGDIWAAQTVYIMVNPKEA
eukprot:133090_1